MKYKTKTQYVEAIKLKGAFVFNFRGKEISAFPGEWLVQSQDGEIFIESDKRFNEMFELCSENSFNKLNHPHNTHTRNVKKNGEWGTPFFDWNEYERRTWPFNTP